MDFAIVIALIGVGFALYGLGYVAGLHAKIEKVSGEEDEEETDYGSDNDDGISDSKRC